MNLDPWLLVPLIFFARIGDVSLGTVRTILVFRGMWLIAGCIGFFEVLIWLLAAGNVLHHLDRWYLIVAYASGFAVGNIVGIWLESRIALGTTLLRAISRNLDIDLAKCLRNEGYAVTELSGNEAEEVPIEVLLIVETRRKLPNLIQRVHELDPDAICTTSDIKQQVTLPNARGYGWRSKLKRK
ncbi:MAG: DUF2179 domain-containing protein [Planctomycetes bacterium]|nr:DUF2179 domain-containing protein [Planctomycetota bacterium]MCB9909735.1 DUF2179 domain-containing protein [Planctomycetota bacterium]MCB9911775.1 DUF2179 domain-containing protein [Planctomycetota bacterium]HPF13293.1 DUF5698 domain-containing protein [Planctomycetota bacterium]HRV80440.1 DUF5698 domain-containing protein [Planctomycetota bacterium]